MKNEHIKEFINDNMVLGECNIFNNENKWKCQLNKLEFNAIKLKNWQQQIFNENKTLTFDIKENKLTIPEKYYDLIVVGYIKKKEE